MTIFKIYGIKFRLNLVFILFLLLYIANGNIIETIIYLITILVHELSHVIACIKLNIKVKEISLFPFGGVAKLDNFIADNPYKEMLISLVGPLANVIIAVLLLLLLSKIIKQNNYLYFGLMLNIYIGFFNLIPILPLDGGRVLRAIISLKFGIKYATNKVISLTYLISFFLIIYGLYILFSRKEGMYLLLIAIFIIIAATKEKRMAAFIFLKEIINKKQLLQRKRVLKTQILVCTKEATLKSILDSFLPGRYHIIIIIDNLGNKVETIYEEKILDSVIKYGLNVTIETLLIID